MSLQKIKNMYSWAEISRCNERCNIRIDTGRNFVMLKGELLVRHLPEKTCDCIIFQNDKKIAIVELKSASLDAKKIIEKFSNSARKSIDIAVNAFCASKKDDFTPYLILLAKKYANYFAHDKLQRSKIPINGKNHRIILGRCGCSLSSYISSQKRHRK